jgi:Flp pilus assembly protein CpaB
MSRRARSVAFLFAAGVAALCAGAIADGYGERVARGYGELDPVLVLTADLRAGAAIDPVALAVRRVPDRFTPPGALRVPAEALGLEAAAPIPEGSYLLATQLRPRGGGEEAGPALGGGRRPVEIAVSGADALLVAGAQPVGAPVDVVVTTEPNGSGGGRTYVAAAAVPLLALGPGEDGDGGTTAATLGLTKGQALRLIAAESFARRVTVLPAAP